MKSRNAAWRLTPTRTENGTGWRCIRDRPVNCPRGGREVSIPLLALRVAYELAAATARNEHAFCTVGVSRPVCPVKLALQVCREVWSAACVPTVAACFVEVD